MTARGDKLKPNTRSMYAMVMSRHFHDWRTKPITKLTWDMVRRRHRKLSETSPTSANQAMRVLRAVLNHAMGEYREDDGSPVLKENPVRALSHDRAWNKEARRQGCIEPHQLPAWWKAVEDLDETARDELYSRMKVLLQHLLKFQFQPDDRSASWLGTIDEQRDQLDISCSDRAHRCAGWRMRRWTSPTPRPGARLLTKPD